MEKTKRRDGAEQEGRLEVLEGQEGVMGMGGLGGNFFAEAANRTRGGIGLEELGGAASLPPSWLLIPE